MKEAVHGGTGSMVAGTVGAAAESLASTSGRGGRNEAKKSSSRPRLDDF
jgi:outer membrane lipoprotein SlyB